MSYWLEIKGTINAHQKAAISVRKLFNEIFRLDESDDYVSNIATTNHGSNYVHKVHFRIRGLTGAVAAVKVDYFVLALNKYKNCKVSLYAEIHWE